MYPDDSRYRKWISVGLAIMFVLIGAAFLLSMAFSSGTARPLTGFRFGWFPFIGVFFLLFFILKWLFFPWGYGYRKHYWREEDRAVQTLRERYAKGEISKEQFEQMHKDLARQNQT